MKTYDQLFFAIFLSFAMVSPSSNAGFEHHPNNDSCIPLYEADMASLEDKIERPISRVKKSGKTMYFPKLIEGVAIGAIFIGIFTGLSYVASLDEEVVETGAGQIALISFGAGAALFKTQDLIDDSRRGRVSRYNGMIDLLAYARGYSAKPNDASKKILNGILIRNSLSHKVSTDKEWLDFTTKVTDLDSALIPCLNGNLMNQKEFLETEVF